MALRSNNSNRNNQQDADAFLNIDVATDDGGQMRLGAVALRLEGSSAQEQVIQWLRANPENVKKLADKLILSFNDMEDRKNRSQRLALG